jgi:hypothetical protein
MLDYLFAQINNKNILVNVDPQLSTSINSHGRINLIGNNLAPIRVPINLFKLIIAIGTVTTRRNKPTWRQKFQDKCDLLERIEEGSEEFKIKIHHDPEVQAETSEEFGIGLSVVVADYFFKLKWRTLSKISLKKRETKPDIKVFSGLNKQIVMEAKGTVHEYTKENQQKPEALRQKLREPSDINIASCALLKEYNISELDFLDPKTVPPLYWGNRQKFFAADHYTRIFNFIGQKELSEYFNLMRKRLKYDKNFNEYNRKEELYEKIKRDYIRIYRNNHTFLGNIERISNEKFIFIGIDKNLISLAGFLNFRDYKQDFFDKEEKNVFFSSSDGLCIAILENLDFIEQQISHIKIKHYQDSISIADIEMMNHFTLNKYFKYLFEQNGCKVEIEKGISVNREDSVKRVVADQVISYKDKEFIVEVKKYFKNYKLLLEQLSRYKSNLVISNLILITLEKVNNSHLNELNNLGIKVIDRDSLKRIIRNPSVLTKWLK